MPLTVGTAGHIDHGKTWLVRALTGKDTDRLPEEQRRGISIDLGYAPLDLPDGRRLSLIDVPGHERFVRNMVAGATGIDLFLLVIDAGEGARPQTHEHLAIIRLLGIEHGVVAVTKADAVDEETLELALEEARELVPEAAAIAVSAKTGAGIDSLRDALGREAELVLQEHKVDRSPARLYVDRVFSLRGIGTVATGTLWSGDVGEGDVLRAEPSGRDVRVRSVQVHDRPVERAEPGQRVALALPGVERSELRRGDVLVAPGSPRPSYRLDVALEELEPIADGARLHVHHGTGAVPARVVKAGGFAQLRLAAPIVAARGDRVVLRDATTLGGGTVLDPAPARHADPARFEQARRGEARVHAPVLVDGEWSFSDEWLAELEATLERELERADPLDPGTPAPTEPWAKDVLARLPFERRGSMLYRPGATGTLGPRAAEAEALASALAAAEPGAAKADDAELARFLERAGRIVRLGDGWAVSAAAYERARSLVLDECAASGQITLGRFRDLAGCGRRDAQLLLERLDADGVTRRVGEARVLRRRSSAPAS
jgi:selenocysteine-specific elongation factor